MVPVEGRIRTQDLRSGSDQKLLAVSGSGKNHSGSKQLRIRNKFEVKLPVL